MISVCIATFNGEKFIEKQLQSILHQLDAGDEVIISDSGSTDDTVKVIQAINDSRVKLYIYSNEENPIQKSAFEKMDKIRNNFQNALLRARGDVIFLADQDDFWHENKVKRVIELLQDADCVVHDCTVVQGGEILMPSFLDYFKPGRTKWSMFYKSPFMGCCMAFKISVLNRSLPFPEMHIEHDTWIGMCAYKTGKVKIADEVLMDYFRHGNNASPIAEKKKNPVYLMFLRRFFMIMAYLRF